MALARVNVSSGGRTPPVIVNVPTQSGTLTYSGSAKTPTWNGYDATQLLIGGTTSATNAGTYTATFTPQGNVTWSDGTSSPKSVTWTIAKATPVLTLSKTSISVGLDSTTTFTVTSPSNGALSVTSSSTDVATVTISGTTATVAGKGAGNATITVSQAAGANYNAASATCTVSVARAALNLSANISGAVTYNTTGTISISGNAGNGAITATSSDTNVIAVTNTSTNSVTVKAISGTGNATITISVAATANYAADSTTCVVTASKATPTLTLSKTSGQVNKDETVTFTATSPSDGTLSVTSSNSNVATATVSGTTITVTGRGSGDATITVSQAATTNYTAKTATYFVAVAKEMPTLTLSETSGTATADNGKVNFTVTSNSTGTITVSSSDATIASVAKSGSTVTVTGKKAGTATITVSQAATTDYAAASATYTVTVTKATPHLTLSKTAGDVVVGSTVQFTVDRTAYSGTLSVTSSDTSVATATISGQTVTVTGVSAGSATITVSLSGNDTYEAVSATYTATTTGVSIITDDWATISSRAKAGTAANYYKVGDCKEITLNGKIGDGLTLNNRKLYVFILHINYPMNGVADNNIIWGGFKKADGTDIALRSGWYGYLDGRDPVYFSINKASTTAFGGWKGCDFRYYVLGACSTPPSDYGKNHTENCIGYDATDATLTTPVANTLLAALPSDFRNALRLWSRWIDAKGNQSADEANIKKTIDAVTLLTEFEVYGVQTYAHPCEQNHQTQMEYYRLGNSTLKDDQSTTVSASNWWLSSPAYQKAPTTHDYGGDFVYAGSAGHSYTTPSGYSFNLAPAFKM